MLKRFLLHALIISFSFSFIQKGGVKIQIDSTVSAQFPKKPDREKKGDEVVFVTDTDNGIYIATVFNNSGTYKIPEDKQGISKFLDGFISGAIKKVKGKEISRKEIALGGVSVKEIKYRGIFPGTEAESVAYRQVFIVKKVIYSFDYWILGEENSITDSEKSMFFGSIAISGK